MNKKELEQLLKIRYENHIYRHPNVKWDYIIEQLNEDKKLFKIVEKMETSGGEPDVCEVIINNKKQLIFTDFSKESPAGRRSLCFDKAAWINRKQNKPISDVETECCNIGAQLLDEILYKQIQLIEPLDLKTSTWLATPDSIRNLGGALFGDCRYNHVFIYHNGAESYYAARGFRTYVIIK